MATEESSSSSPSVDSYIGSVISLTSKSEIRYEGVLVSINPHESTIALQNVKSYGTEGRRKEGPQIPPSDKVYEYILFRGSDIKDLQVKSTPPVHPKQQTHNDPAIIQSHYAYAPATHNPAIPAASVGGVALTGLSSSSVPQDIGRQPFPDASSLYQAGDYFNSWMPSSTISNFNGPMQSQGYIGTSSRPAHAQPQSGPFHSQSISLQNPLQYPEGYAPTSMAKFPENAPSLTFPSQSVISKPYNSSSLLSSNAPSLTFPSLSAISNPYNSSSLLSSNTPLASSLHSHVPTMSSLSSSKHEMNGTGLISNKASPPQSSFLPVSSMPFSSSSILGSSSCTTTTPPSLLTPNQLTKSTPAATSSLHKLYPEPKDKEALLPSSTNTSSTVSGMPQEPLLPLPIPSQQAERGVTQFTDEFDFTAMNEKFNKGEVWGSLGKEKQGVASGDGTEDGASHYNVEVNDGYGQGPPNSGSKSVYNKDDFFDTLSCNSLNRGGWSGRTRLSERRKLDTETFGEFQQGPPTGRGNYGAPHSGYYRGSYNRGRGYGYYGGRGRGGDGGGGYRPSY